MKWINGIPQANGLYWLCREGKNQIVLVWDIDAGLNEYEAMMSYIGTDKNESLYNVLEKKCQWYGPLISPKGDILCK